MLDHWIDVWDCIFVVLEVDKVSSVFQSFGLFGLSKVLDDFKNVLKNFELYFE